MYSTYNSSDNYATGISYITTPDKAASKVYSLSGKDATNLSENEAIVSSSLLLSIYNSSCENSADRISLPKTDIMYLIPEYATAVEDYATATLVSNRAAFDSFIADNDLSGKTDEEIIDAYKKYYFSALYGSEAVAYAGKSSQDFINEVKAKAVADYMNKLQTKILSLPKLRFEIDNYMTSEQTTAYFDIAGFYIEDEAGYDDTVFIPQAAIDGFDADLTQNNPYSFALAKMPDKESDLKKIVAFGYSSENDIGYTLQNSVTTTLSLVNDVIEEMSEVLLYIGIGFAVFAAFLMMNFIATSISYKKREIGILRAVGARSTDVFGIFFSESFIIACINWIISVVFTVIATVVINSMLRKDYDLQITLLNFGIRQIALILGVALVVALIASLLPVARIARKKPIDAIRNH
jgi:ABC-type antimicrobial peptide transport system permease subunit